MKKIFILFFLILLFGCSTFFHLLGYEDQKVIPGKIVNLSRFDLGSAEINYINNYKSDNFYNAVIPVVNYYPNRNNIVISKDTHNQLYISFPIILYNKNILATYGITKTTDVNDYNKEVSDECIRNINDCISSTYENEIHPITNLYTLPFSSYKSGDKFQFEKHIVSNNNVTIIMARTMNKNYGMESNLVPNISGIIRGEGLLHIAVMNFTKADYGKLLRQRYTDYLNSGVFTESIKVRKSFDDNMQGNGNNLSEPDDFSYDCKNIDKCMLSILANRLVTNEYRENLVESKYEIKQVNAGKGQDSNYSSVNLNSLAGLVNSGALQSRRDISIPLKLLTKDIDFNANHDVTVKYKMDLCITYEVKQIMFSKRDKNCQSKDVEFTIPKGSTSSNVETITFGNVVTNFGMSVGGINAMSASIVDMKLNSKPTFVRW